jgi:hypothetical protein
MSYIGAQPTTASFPFDQFSGNGSTTAFTLSYAPAGTTSIIVSISGVVQNPNTYTVSGVTLTFSPAPPTGTNNIGVLYLGLPAIAGGGGASTPAAVSDQANTSTGFFDVPSGTTAERPVSATTGSLRYNSTTGFCEWYDGTNWYQFNQAKTYTAQYLVIAGGGGAGGGGAAAYGGGGGGGGYVTNTTSLNLGTTYSFVVGGGGAGQINGGAQATNGTDSTGFGVTAIGGGYGGTNLAGRYVGNSGGSGGGGGGTSQAGGSGTAGQGFAGGVSTSTSSASTGAGGGGGGGGAVGAAATNNGGNGGVGVSSSITGAAAFYAGGGGGSCRNTAGTGGTGGSGGGGNGVAGTGNGANGSANTGGGGGGGFTTNGGAGGSGAVIIAVPSSNYSGVVTGSPTVTTSGLNTIITFTSSGSYTA